MKPKKEKTEYYCYSIFQFARKISTRVQGGLAIRFIHLPGKHRADGHKDKNTANLEDLVLSEIKQQLL